MAAITAVTITVTPPGGAPFPINVTATDATAKRGAIPSAIEEVAVEWGQTAPLASQSAGEFSLVLWSATPNVIPYESLVQVTASIDGRPATLIARGWATVPKWLPRRIDVDGVKTVVYVTRVTCLGAVTRAGATTLTDATWPPEAMAARLNRFDAAATLAIVDRASIGADRMYLDARKVATSDNIAGVLAAGLAGHKRVMVETAGGVGAADLPGAFLDWPHTEVMEPGPEAGAYVSTIGDLTTPAVQPLNIPAAAVEETWRGPDRTATITRIIHVARDTFTGEPAENVITPTVEPAVRSSSELRIDADVPYSLDEWAWALLNDMAAAQPAVMLEQTRIRLADLPAATVEALIGIPGRAARDLQIDDCPDDLDPFQLVTTGRLTIASGLTATLDVTLQPASLAGCRPIRWSETRTETRFRQCNIPDRPATLWLTANRVRQIMTPTELQY